MQSFLVSTNASLPLIFPKIHKKYYYKYVANLLIIIYSLLSDFQHGLCILFLKLSVRILNFCVVLPASPFLGQPKKSEICYFVCEVSLFQANGFSIFFCEFLRFSQDYIF